MAAIRVGVEGQQSNRAASPHTTARCQKDAAQRTSTEWDDMMLNELVLPNTTLHNPRFDAELKKQLVGTWNDREIGLVTVLKANGTLVSTRPHVKWDVKDGHFIEIGTTHGDLTFTIVSVTRHKFVFRDDAHQHGTGVWTRD